MDRIKIHHNKEIDLSNFKSRMGDLLLDRLFLSVANSSNFMKADLLKINDRCMRVVAGIQKDCTNESTLKRLEAMFVLATEGKSSGPADLEIVIENLKVLYEIIKEKEERDAQDRDKV